MDFTLWILIYFGLALVQLPLAAGAHYQILGHFFQSSFRQEKFRVFFLRLLQDGCQSIICGNTLKDCFKRAILL